MYVLPAVSSTTKAHIPRLAASKLTRFIPVLTFTRREDQSSGHHPVRRGIPEQIPIPGTQFLQLKSKASWSGEVISNTWVNASL